MNLRKFLPLVLVILLVALSVSVVSAQKDSLCSEVGVASAGNILVDVPAGADPSANIHVRCNILRVNGVDDVGEGDKGAVGTSGLLAGAYVSAVDVFLIGSDYTGYGIFNQPVRTCFKVANPENYYVVLEEARNWNNPGLREFARTVTVLDMVDAGIELGYACGDTLIPGTVSLYALPPDGRVFTQQIDRCAIQDKTCQDLLGG